MAAATEASFGVFSARADELERSRPFGVLADALGFVAEVPEGSVAVPGLEYRHVDQIVERPVVMGLEDLQWADPGTLVALRALGRRLAHLPVALLGTFRPSPRSAELERLIEDWEVAGAVHLVLRGLEHARVLELAAESLPPSLRLTILRRVGLLGDSALSLLRIASLLGTTFSLADLSTVSGRAVAVVVDELLDARRAGVVEEAGALLRFRHDLVREALYLDLPESARRALHREAGRSLARAGAPRLRVAEQLSLGASPGDREAVGWLVAGRGAGLVRAPETAVALLERAAALADPSDPARDHVLADLADALVVRPTQRGTIAGGRPPRARRDGRHTRPSAGDGGRGLWLDGRWHELVEQVDRWLGGAGPELTPHARGRMLADQ